MSVFRYLGRRNRKADSRGRSPRPTRLTFETLESRALVTSDLLTSVPLAIASTDGGTNSTPTAVQTASANSNPTTPINFTLVITDQNDQPITGPLVVGQQFFIDVYIDDERNVANPGVDGAITDVLFDSTVMTPSGNPITSPNNSLYPVPTSGSHGNYNAGSNADRITDVKGFVPVNPNGGSNNIPIVTPPGAGPLLLDRIQMTATGASATTTILTASPQSDPTDSQTVTVGPNGDAAPAADIGHGSVTTQIVAPVTASLTGGSATAGATATTIQFTASLSGAAAAPVTIHYATTDGTATAGTDYTGVSNGTVQIAAGAQSANFNITVAADVNSHAARNFTVAITGIDVSPTGLVTPGAADHATGTINFGTPNVAIANAAVQAGTTATTISFPVTLSGTFDQAVVLNYSTSSSGDTAIAGTDYTQETNQKLTIPAGALTSSIVIPIPAESQLFTGSRTFHVNIGLDGSDTSGAHLTTNSVQGTITSASPSLAIGDATAQAGSSAGTISFPIHLLQASSQPIVLQYSTVVVAASGDTAVSGTDFTAHDKTQLTIPAGVTDVTIPISIAAQTTPFGTAAKTFHVTISPDPSDTSGVQITDSSAVGSITSPAPTLSVSDATVQSTATAGTISFTVQLNGPASQAIKLDYTTSIAQGDTAVATDFTAQSGTQLTIQPNATSATIQIPIAAQATAFSAAKTFHLAIKFDDLDTSGAQIATATAVGTITSPAPTLSLGNATAQAGATTSTISFPVHLSAASSQPVVIDYSTSIPPGDTAASTDFTAASGTKFTIDAGVTDTTIQIPIAAQATPFSAAKTFHLNITKDVSNPPAVQITVASAVGTITSPAPTLSLGNATAQAGTSSGTLSFPVTLNGPASQDIVLDVTAASIGTDSAVAGTDYTQFTKIVTIPKGTTSTTIDVTIAAQTGPVSDKTFHLTISKDSTDQSGVQLGTTSAVGTITSEPAVVVLAGSDTPTKLAPSVMTFSVQLLNQAGGQQAAAQPVTVQYRVVSDTSKGENAVGGSDITKPGVDYLAVDTTAANPLGQPLVIPAGITSTSINIPVAAQFAGTGTKTFHLEILSVSQGAFVSSVAHSAVGTIHLNQIPKPVASIQNSTLVEPTATGQNMQFTVSLSAPSNTPVVVNYAISPGTALANVDYTPPTGQGTITIPALATSATISVPILPDANVAPSAKFQVTISTPNGNTDSSVNPAAKTATGTILTDGSFAGTVYIDTNNDGIQGAGEHVLPGVTVTVAGTSATGQAEQFTTTSGADGKFSFAAIPPGTYTVTQTAPAGYVIGSATAGTGATASGSQMTFTITSGDTLVNNNLAERGLQPQLITRRMYLSSIIA